MNALWKKCVVVGIAAVCGAFCCFSASSPRPAIKLVVQGFVTNRYSDIFVRDGTSRDYYVCAVVNVTNMSGQPFIIPADRNRGFKDRILAAGAGFSFQALVWPDATNEVTFSALTWPKPRAPFRFLPERLWSQVPIRLWLPQEVVTFSTGPLSAGKQARPRLLSLDRQ
jgi:hypothetical protein